MDMDKVIEKAKQIGVGIGVVRNSNHFGIAGYYVRKALDAGLSGIALTNTRPLVVPTNATEAFLGSNAFAFGFPASPHPFIFDGATSVVAGGKIQLADKKGIELPGNWVVDKNRQVVKDPKEAESILATAAFEEEQKGGGLLTLGGSEVNSNYKGMGNSIVVEILTGILAQGSISADTNTTSASLSLLLIRPSLVTLKRLRPMLPACLIGFAISTTYLARQSGYQATANTRTWLKIKSTALTLMPRRLNKCRKSPLICTLKCRQRFNMRINQKSPRSFSVTAFIN